jgi:histidinol dehydrogenase
MKPASITNHRGREGGLSVYPCYSRRSGGLSVGVNLYLDANHCPFDCPYCEVFPFRASGSFDLDEMRRDLESVLARAKDEGIPVRDICFSGNGEPTVSPDFPAALAAAAAVRQELCPEAVLVVITCGAGLLRGEAFDLLAAAANGPERLDIWLKLDAGTEAWFRKINGAAMPFAPLQEAIRAFVKAAPVTIQTMHCSVNGGTAPVEDIAAWEAAIVGMERGAPGHVRRVQIYGKARPSPHDRAPDTAIHCEALPLSALEARAASLNRAFKAAGLSAPPIMVYE